MAQEAPPTTYLKDYLPAPYIIDSLFLNFSLEPHTTRVASRLELRPNPASQEKNAALVLGWRKDQAHQREA